MSLMQDPPFGLLALTPKRHFIWASTNYGDDGIQPKSSDEDSAFPPPKTFIIVEDLHHR